MRTLVVGASGLVGSALLRAAGSDGVGTYRTRADPAARLLQRLRIRRLARKLPEYDPSKIRGFVEAHYEGPDAPERNAP